MYPYFAQYLQNLLLRTDPVAVALKNNLRKFKLLNNSLISFVDDGHKEKAFSNLRSVLLHSRPKIMGFVLMKNNILLIKQFNHRLNLLFN